MSERGQVVVLGASGQVGRAALNLLGRQALGMRREDLDLEDVAAIETRLERLRPAAVINGAAYTQVDRAEAETARAQRINGEAPGVLARWCRQRDIPLVHFSTDYVFSGAGERPYTEEDATGPLNAYGRSKLEGERQVAEAGGSWLIFRTSWLYDSCGSNFLTTMLRLGASREELSVVDDQHGAPTYAPHLAAAVVEALARAMRAAPFPTGIYHLANAGCTSWYGFAQAIFQAARRRGLPLAVSSVRPISTAEYPGPAPRPGNSRLDVGKVARVLGVSLPSWEAGLEACMECLP